MTIDAEGEAVPGRRSGRASSAAAGGDVPSAAPPAHPSRDERSGRSSAWILAGICPAAFVTILNAFALGPFLPAIGRELGTSVAALGQIPATVSAIAAVLGLVLGPIADRYGHRSMLLVGLLAVVVSAVGAAVAPTFGLLLVAAIAGAVGRAVVTPVSLAIVGTQYVGLQARRAMSYVVAALSGSAVLGIPALTMVAAATGTWRGALAILGLGALGVLVVAAIVLPTDGPRAGGAAGLRALLGTYGPLIGHRPTLGLVGSSLLRSAAAVMVFLYWGAFLIERHGLDVTAVGIGYSVTGFGHFSGSLVAGRWLGEAPTRARMVLLTALAGAALGAAMVAPAGPLVAIALATVGFSMIGGVEVAIAMLLSTETPGGRATTMTLNSSAQSLGGAVGSAIGGLLLLLGGYVALGVGVPVLTAASALVLLSSRPARAELRPHAELGSGRRPRPAEE